ncbi:MAG: M14 family zinc carboxypeptidase [Actinomycetota bacterium]
MRISRFLTLAGAVAVVASTLVVGGAPPVIATPVATNDALYSLYGRVFPDPHGCTRGLPLNSPWAKGNVCAVQFVQWDEAVGGLEFLESRFDRYLDVLSGDELREVAEDLTDDELRSAGLPREDLTRDRRDLTVVKVTDDESPVPEADRKHFAYSLAIHGIERAGLEGGIRAAEDLVTWAACEADPDAAPACSTEGPFPKQILEPFDTDPDDPSVPPEAGPTAGQVLANGVVYLIFSNPDGWNRGDYSEGGVFYQRYNGNGMDLNRDWATVGYTEAQYTPFSEPESRGYAKFLEAVKDQTAEGRFAGAIDLHGMVTARAFSFTLLGAGQRDFRKNEITVRTSVTTFRDSEERLSWSPLIAPRESCPVLRQDVGILVSEAAVQMCSDQWGTVWDTINYQITGGMGDWMDSPLGLDAVGIDNEMALSHLAPNNVFEPGLEQLHIDGNKGLIYAQIASLLFEEPVAFQTPGRVGHVFDPSRITNPGGQPADPGLDELPPQDDIEGTEVTGAQGFSFTVNGPEDGVFNGGLTVEATGANARGIGVHTGTGVLSVFMILDYCGPAQHPGDPDNVCREVARYFNQSPIYSQAGARIDLNNPPAGPYRIRPNQARVGPTHYTVSFSKGPAYPVPEQAPYDVSRMDFFTELNQYATPRLRAVGVKRVLQAPEALDRFDSVVVAGELMPGFDPDPAQSRWTASQFQAYVDALAGFAARGGNLVLTDAALAGLPALGTGIPPEAVRGGFFYAGWMDFDDGGGPTYDRHHLAHDVNKEGAAEGAATIGGQAFDNRHQTYEPVPLGYYVGPGGAGNQSCNSDRCDSPNWIVDQGAWEGAGGTTAARTLVRESTAPNTPTQTGVSLGEIPLGDGMIRIAGAVLPDPTEENFHPYGLFSYALTYTGYQVFENLIDYRR